MVTNFKLDNIKVKVEKIFNRRTAAATTTKFGDQERNRGDIMLQMS
jgi:hypothetical protein